MSEDEQFNQAFGECDISEDIIDTVRGIKNNHPDVNDLKMRSSDAEKLNDQAWRLLGRYIAKNTHLERVDLVHCNLTDGKMASLFYELKYSSSLKDLFLCHNSFGIDGLRCMVPFLTDTNLFGINFYRNSNINNECFELLVQTLHGRPLESRSLNSLFIGHCNITNITALDTYNLPNLQRLNLDRSNIGRDGYTTLINILQKEDSNLIYLDVDNTGMGDEEAELLTASLENNIKLQTLYLRGNSITERGFKAFLKLLIDASSIENTYNSNHTLTKLWFPMRTDVTMRILLDSAVELNKQHHSSHSAGRAKLIKYQLNSQNRKVLCRLQGIEYCSIGTLLSDLEPTLLPRILALIGREHGQSEFYTSLIPMVPDLMSCVDTGDMMKDLMVKNEAQAGTLRQQANALMQQASALMQQASVITAKNGQLSRRLSERESGDSHHSSKGDIKETVSAESGTKRQRSEDRRRD